MLLLQTFWKRNPTHRDWPKLVRAIIKIPWEGLLHQMGVAARWETWGVLPIKRSPW